MADSADSAASAASATSEFTNPEIAALVTEFDKQIKEGAYEIGRVDPRGVMTFGPANQPKPTLDNFEGTGPSDLVREFQKLICSTPTSRDFPSELARKYNVRNWEGYFEAKYGDDYMYPIIEEYDNSPHNFNYDSIIRGLWQEIAEIIEAGADVGYVWDGMFCKWIAPETIRPDMWARLFDSIIHLGPGKSRVKAMVADMF